MSDDSLFGDERLGAMDDSFRPTALHGCPSVGYPQFMLDQLFWITVEGEIIKDLTRRLIQRVHEKALYGRSGI